MRGIILLIICFSVLLSSCDSSTEPKSPNFIAVYPTVEKINPFNFSSPELEEEDFFNHEDILYYEWSTHTIHFTKEGLAKIAKDSRDLLQKNFILVVNGEDIYAGTFWSPLFSSICAGPVISLLPQNSGYTFMYDQCTIENGYHWPTETEDPRSNEKLYKALKENNLLKE